MKSKWMMAIVCVAMCALVACKDSKKDEPENPQPSQPTSTDINGNKTRPSWAVPDEYDYTSSMTAVIRIEKLAGKTIAETDVTEDDLLAAFNGDSCLGVTSPQEGLFFLYICGTEGDVSLRYYSAHYKNIFEQTAAFPFKNDTQKGTVSDPYVPEMVVKQ